jgi:hypothetical protein
MVLKQSECLRVRGVQHANWLIRLYAIQPFEQSRHQWPDDWIESSTEMFQRALEGAQRSRAVLLKNFFLGAIHNREL